MKECISCITKQTQQWYSGPLCKSCYRKQHRKNNLKAYKEKDAKLYRENLEYIKNRQNVYYRNNLEDCKARSKQHRKEVGDQHIEGYFKLWRDKNPEKIKRYKKEYKDNHPDRVKLSSKKYVKQNLHKYRYREAEKRAKKLQATPIWLSKEQINEIKTIYKNCPKGYHVDHIIPLLGKEVRGLHVPWNLQYLLAIDNIKKSNKL